MKLTRTLPLAVLCFFLSLKSFSQSYTSAVQYNDYLVSINDSLYQLGKQWGTKYNTVKISKSFDSLGLYRLKLDAYINKKKLELRSHKDFLGSSEFRDAMIAFLTFEAKMMREAFAPFEDLNSKSTPEEIQAAVKKLSSISADENVQLARLNVAQLEYARKNNFTIQKN